MNQKMLTTRTVMKESQKLLKALKEDNPNHILIPTIEDLYTEYESQYENYKHISHEPSMVYQLYGKKTSELTPDEGRAYRALLKRQRYARKREMRGK